MNTSFYLEKFQKIADQLDQNVLREKSIEVAVGVYLDSVVLKLYKKSWASNAQEPLSAESRIFFSVWVNDSNIKNQKIMYNIHALKLRKLKGYKIESRKFAEAFRNDFKNQEINWPNVSVNHGPLTLMEGWLKLDFENFEDEVLKVTNSFLDIENLIDDTLSKFKTNVI